MLNDGVAGNSLFAETIGDERHRDAGEEDEEGRGESAAELRPVVERGVVEVGTEPGVVAMGLEHEEAGQAAHPVDVDEAGGLGGERHGLSVNGDQ